jgi:prophage antirepressor-like protein
MKTENFAIQLFDGKKVRIAWDAEQEKYYFAVADIVQVLTEQPDYQLARNYWKVLKNRLVKEGNETVTNCNQLKLPAADGKKRLTDVADLQGIFRIIQSIPSTKAEPVKDWLAGVGAEVQGQGLHRHSHCS